MYDKISALRATNKDRFTSVLLFMDQISPGSVVMYHTATGSQQGDGVFVELHCSRMSDLAVQQVMLMLSATTKT